MAKKDSTSKKSKEAKRGLSTTSLAVKYRPRTLDDLVGQAPVATQVRGMVKSGRFPSTIGLFGESGAGKTTIGRMIARYINCLSPDKTTGLPCGECASCKYGDSHPDLHEINMADSRGIDDVRQMIQSSRAMPSLGNKRIFLLDEVHACYPLQAKILVEGNKFLSFAEIREALKSKKKINAASYNFETKRVEFKRITHFHPKKAAANSMVRIHVQQLGVSCYIESTGDHKTWNSARGDWIEAKDFVAWDTLQSNIPVGTVVTGVETLENDEFDVADITVDGNHNFFVLPVGGSFPILTKNCTPQAFQAWLKPLEDAPEHTVWILATTNPEKLPPTILGRCHKFNIKPIPEEDIIKRLRIIAKREGVDFKEMEGGKDILSTIANLSNGRMRDSIQSLESVLFALASGEKFSAKTLITEYATTAEADLDKMSAKLLIAILSGDAKTVIQCVIDSRNVRGLISKTRWLLHSLVSQSVSRNFFKTYSWRCFNDGLRGASGVKVKLSMLLEIQDLLCTVETQLNSMSIDENVLFTSRLGRFLVDHRQ